MVLHSYLIQLMLAARNMFKHLLRLIMDPIYRIKQSRDIWKDKARERADKIRDYRKQSRRQQERIRLLQQQLSEQKSEVELLKKNLQ